MSVLTQFRWKGQETAIITRAALRGIGSSLNFSLVTLASQHLRSLRYGVAVPEVDEHYGHSLDQRNEIDLEIEGETVEAAVREEQGFAYTLSPIQLAGYLKVIRDSIAAELLPYAGMRMNPITKVKYPYEFDIVPAIENSLNYLLGLPAKISEAAVANTVAVLRIDEHSVRQMLERDHAIQQKFLKDNKLELLGIINDLSATGEDGHAFGIDDDETVEERLPAINRARLYVSADNGLVSRRQVDVKAYSRGNPNAFGNIGMVDGERNLLRAKFNEFMKQDHIKDEIAEAVSNGAKMPILKDLFPEIGTVKKAA